METVHGMGLVAVEMEMAMGDKVEMEMGVEVEMEEEEEEVQLVGWVALEVLVELDGLDQNLIVLGMDQVGVTERKERRKIKRSRIEEARHSCPMHLP